MLSAAHNHIRHFRLLDLKIRLRLEHFAHLQAISLLVALRPRRPDGRPTRSVEQAKLDSDRVRNFAHDAAKRIHFAHQVPLSDAANRRVSGRAQKSHRKERIRTRATAGSGSDHPASKENGRKDRAAVRPLGVGTLPDRAPQRNRSPVRLPLFRPPQRLRQPNPERPPPRTRLTRPVGRKAPTHPPNGPGSASIRTLKGTPVRSYEFASQPGGPQKIDR